MELAWEGLAPEQAALLVRDTERPFALIGRWAGGGALIGSEPVAVAPDDADPFAMLEALPEVAGRQQTDSAADAVIGGGWFGYLGYNLGAKIERLDPPPPQAGPSLPDFSLAFYDHLIHLDAAGRWWFEALATPGRQSVIEARLDHFRNLPAASTHSCPSFHPPRGETWTAVDGCGRGGDPIRRPFNTEPWRAVPAAAGHGRAVAACRERIHAGDLFQANICQRLTSRLTGDPLDLFACAVPPLKPDRAAYLAGPWGAVASLSPELFLERRGRRVRTAPIKGTRPRPEDSGASETQRSDLTGSTKDRAENQMIVDMARNDLGRVCRYGSIKVETTAEARAHTGVWHLVSEVSAELHPGLGDRALLRATFPPASVTGAPKVAAQNVIAELESTRRQTYTGAIGFASPTFGLELSVTIRTFEFGPEQQPDSAPRSAGTEEQVRADTSRDAWLGVGGGIVADSKPADEGDECLTKALPLLAAIGAELALPRELNVGEESRTASIPPPTPRRFGPKPFPRPDPAAGIFETILVEAARPLQLDRHLARLTAGAIRLYGIEPAPDLGDRIEVAAATRHEPCRLRVDLRPGVPDRIVVSPLAARPSPTGLSPVCLAGGLGPHKWADRTLLDRLGGLTAPHIPLLIDLDGTVLEAAHASVFADFGDGRLITPPADGRILPGTARARLLSGEIALPTGLTCVIEAPLTLADLFEAEAIYIANSLTTGLHDATLMPSPSVGSRSTAG